MTENNDNYLKQKIRSFFQSESTVKGLFITSIAGASALLSFSFALTSARRRNSSGLDNVSAQVYESGTQLAVRALKWGTLYAFTGCGILIFGVWKVANVNNMEEFREKMGSLFPKVPKNNPPQSRSEFASISELLQYLDDEFSTKKTINPNDIDEDVKSS